MTKIVLIRHGETAWNAMGMIQGNTDTDLNDKGRHQAKCCGMYLSKGKLGFPFYQSVMACERNLCT